MTDIQDTDASDNAAESEAASVEETIEVDVPVHETKLRQIAESVVQGKTVTASPREILSWFGQKRRGVNVVNYIQFRLKQHDLVTVPDFEYEFIDGIVSFQSTKVEKPSEASASSSLELNSTADVTKETIAEEDVDRTPDARVITTDPTYRIGKLAAANKAPIAVSPDAEINQAVTLMMAHDYSQLPIMVGERTVKGLFSWKTLAEYQHFHSRPATVKDCMSTCHIISSEMSIFDAVSEIVRHQVVLVRNPSNNAITGIVTTTDLGLQFRQLGEPFLLLGEIENHIRRLLDGCFNKQELESVRDPSDDERTIDSVADLTFGEYLRLIENPDRWTKLGLAQDRKVFIEQLDTVRLIRNDVMHFDPDGIADEDLSTLREFAAYLQSLANVTSKKDAER